MRKISLNILAIIPSWYAMMLVHEFGHMIHAWVSGGVVSHLEFGLFEFSRTDFSHNPHPLFVAWGGRDLGLPDPAGTRRRVRQAGRFSPDGQPGSSLASASSPTAFIWERAWTLMAGDAGDLIRHDARALATYPVRCRSRRVGPLRLASTGENMVM